MTQNSYLKIVENLKKEDSELNKIDTEINNNFKNELEKVKFIDRIQTKINKLSNFRVYLQFKYNDIKFSYDFFSIFLIIISAFLTIIEAVKNEIDYEDSRNDVKYFFKLSPIFISSLITLLGTFIKFKKYQEDSEQMSSVLEKSVITIHRMKKLQEKLYYADNLKLESLKDMYIDEIFILYNQSQVEIRNCVSYTDFQKYELKRLKYEKLNLKKKNLGLRNTKKKRTTNIINTINTNKPNRIPSEVDSSYEYNFRDNINASPGPGAENYNYDNMNQTIKIYRPTPIRHQNNINNNSSINNNNNSNNNINDNPSNNNSNNNLNDNPGNNNINDNNLSITTKSNNLTIIDKENKLESYNIKEDSNNIKEESDNVKLEIEKQLVNNLKEEEMNYTIFNSPDNITGIRDLENNWSSDYEEDYDESDNIVNNNPDKMTSRMNNNVVKSYDF